MPRRTGGTTLGVELIEGTAVEFEGYMYVREIWREKPRNSYTFRVVGVDALLKRYFTPQLQTVDVVGLGEQDVGYQGLKWGILPSQYITLAVLIRH